MRIAVANLKGGTAKTTTAVYLARYLGATVVDADPQGSATTWAEAVAREDGAQEGRVAGLGVPVVHLPDPKLAGRLPGADRIVIDCSPRDHNITDAAIALADLVVVPTATTSADMERTWATLDLAARLGTPAAVLLVRARPLTLSFRAALEALADEKATVLKARIPQREALAVAWGHQLGPAAFGYDLAAREVEELVRVARGPVSAGPRPDSRWKSP
jgi:chromosome partitioning protein